MADGARADGAVGRVKVSWGPADLHGYEQGWRPGLCAAGPAGLAVVLGALLAPPGTLLLLRAVPALDLFLRSAMVHLVVVSAISACGWVYGRPRCGPWPRAPTCTMSARSASPTMS